MNNPTWTPNIEFKRPEDLQPYMRNAKAHSVDQIQELAGQITRSGFLVPIVVDKEGVIISGHCRREASISLMLERVPVIVADHLSEDEVVAARIADNRVSEAPWQLDTLRFELNTLKSHGVDLKTVGFADHQIGDFLETGFMPQEAFEPRVLGTEFAEGKSGGTPEPLANEDNVPAEAPARARRGEVYQIGDHRVMCGDSTSDEDTGVLMEGHSADMIFTDPPWNVNYGAVEQGNDQGYKPRTIMNDFMKPEEWQAFCTGFVNSLWTRSKPGCPIYLVMSAQEWPTIDKTLRDVGFHWSSTVIWAKDRLVLSRKDYHTQYEPIWYGWNSDGPRLVQLEDRCQSDLWHFDRPSRSDIHPTTKPVELVERAILNSSKPGDLVLDLFGGSGSTMLAAHKAKRRSRLMELDPKYCDAIIARMEDFTGLKAELIREADETQKVTE